jgi:opacity protein-like surface antigen
MPLDAEAQQDEQTFGGGLVYGSELEKLGIQLNYYYFLTALLAVGGDFTLFFPESEEAGGVKSTATWMAFNINAHYILFTAIAMRAYVLAGLNFALFRFKVSGGGFSVSDSTSEIGLNLGGGIEYALAVGFLFAELKYIIGEFDQLVIAAGYRYRFGL